MRNHNIPEDTSNGHTHTHTHTYTQWHHWRLGMVVPAKASCGIRAHDLPLTERVLCQLS